jgi:hypothetical protein
MSIVVIRLLDNRGIFSSETRCFGSVEIRPEGSDTPREREALKRSSQEFQYVWQNNCMRIVTILDVADEREADMQAEELFEECLDALASSSGISKMALLPIGAYRSTSNASISHRAPRSSLPSTGFKIAYENFPQCEWAQYIIRSTTDLGKVLLRSYHWSRKAAWEANTQLRILFRWFAMEAIWMVKIDDNIVPRVRWALGFPNGAGLLSLTENFRERLQVHADYKPLSHLVHNRLEGVRDFRNKTVHSGFRQQDISREELSKFDLITALSCGRVQKLVQHGILYGLETPEDLVEYLPVLVENSPNYIRDVHGTVFYSLLHRAAHTRPVANREPS